MCSFHSRALVNNKGSPLFVAAFPSMDYPIDTTAIGKTVDDAIVVP